jgi:predicted amidophosphoribosyltransferase
LLRTLVRAAGSFGIYERAEWPRPPQLLLTRAEHWESVRGAYAITPGAKVDNLRVLLVDDVLTTGATLDACYRALRSAAAASVLGLTVARARLSLVASEPVHAPAASGEGANQAESAGI